MSSRSREAPRVVADIAAAVMLLTRVPVRWERFSSTPPDLARSAWANPLVGLIVGGVGACSLTAARALGLPALAASLLAVGVQCLATGGFHEDGLADAVDGFGGGRTREAKLEIMKDSRVGTYGSLALLFAVGLRVAAIADLPVTIAALGLIAAGAASRAAIVVILRGLDNVRPEGLGATLRQPTNAELLTAVVLGIAPGFVALGTVLAVGCLAAGVVVAVFVAATARRQIGGYTGDVLGAGQQIFEVSFLLMLATLASA